MNAINIYINHFVAEMLENEETSLACEILPSALALILTVKVVYDCFLCNRIAAPPPPPRLPKNIVGTTYITDNNDKKIEIFFEKYKDNNGKLYRAVTVKHNGEVEELGRIVIRHIKQGENGLYNPSDIPFFSPPQGLTAKDWASFIASLGENAQIKDSRRDDPREKNDINSIFDSILVHSIYSQKNKIYRGVGTALMQLAMEKSHLKKCAGRIALFAEGSILFYDKLGFVCQMAEKQGKLSRKRCGEPIPVRDNMYLPQTAIEEWKKKIEAKPILYKTAAHISQSR